MEQQTIKRLRSGLLLALLSFAVLATVGIMIDIVDDSQLDENTAVPRPEQVQPSPPNDSSIGQEAGPYR